MYWGFASLATATLRDPLSLLIPGCRRHSAGPTCPAELLCRTGTPPAPPTYVVLAPYLFLSSPVQPPSYARANASFGPRRARSAGNIDVNSSASPSGPSSPKRAESLGGFVGESDDGGVDATLLPSDPRNRGLGLAIPVAGEPSHDACPFMCSSCLPWFYPLTNIFTSTRQATSPAPIFLGLPRRWLRFWSVLRHWAGRDPRSRRCSLRGLP